MLQDLGDEIVRIVPHETLAIDVVKYCEENMYKSVDYQLTSKEAKAAAEYWSYLVAPVPEPKMFSWPDETGLTFARLPWRAVAGDCPTWDRLMARMSNAKAFKAFIGSLFDPLSYLQQYIWLRGEGNDGKGSINRFLSRVLGLAYCSKQPKERGDKFWAHELLGKRLVVFPDCNDQSFVASGFFKTLTGGDPIGVEAKGRMSYTTRLNCKYLILSNERPGVSSEVADLRRLIYCEIDARDASEPVPTDDAFEAQLWAEGGAFLASCISEYERGNGTGKPIAVTGDQLKDIVETNELDFEEVFDFYFEIDEKDRANWVQPVYLQRVLKQAFKSVKTQREFLSYIERVYGVKKQVVRHDNNQRIKQYKGLVTKPLRIVAEPAKRL